MIKEGIMFYIKENCPACETKPLLFRTTKLGHVFITCWECGGCFEDARKISIETILVPDSEGCILMHGEKFNLKHENFWFRFAKS